jgi:hypothetical protein
LRRGAVVLRSAADGGGAPASVASSTNGAAASQAVTGVAVFSAAPYVRDFFEGARARGELVVRPALRCSRHIDPRCVQRRCWPPFRHRTSSSRG